MQQDGGNRGSYSNVGYLADAAGGFVVPIGVGVRRNLQEEEKGKQRQQNDDPCGPPATRTGTRRLHCVSCEQTLPPRSRTQWVEKCTAPFLSRSTCDARPKSCAGPKHLDVSGGDKDGILEEFLGKRRWNWRPKGPPKLRVRFAASATIVNSASRGGEQFVPDRHTWLSSEARASRTCRPSAARRLVHRQPLSPRCSRAGLSIFHCSSWPGRKRGTPRCPQRGRRDDRERQA